MIRPGQRLAWFGAAALLCAAACDPSEPLPVLCPWPEGDSGGGGAGGGGSGLSGPDTLVVDVVTTGLDDFVAQHPAAGAVVALDLVGGRRVEQTVGADGRVAFEGLDWSQGDSAALTAYVPGYLPHSFVGLTAESVVALAELDGTEVLTVPLAPVDPEMVLLSGIATPMIDPSSSMVVRATTRDSTHVTTGPGWATRVPRATPATLVALEARGGTTPVSPRGQSLVLAQWAELAHDGVDSDTNGVVIDMGAVLPATNVSGSFAVPSHGISDFFDQAKGIAGVSSVDSNASALFGHAVWSDVSADGFVVEYDMQYVEPAAVELPFSHHTLRRGAHERSRLRVAGYPTAGAQAGVLPEPVGLVKSDPVTLGESIAWEMNAVDAADPLLRVQIAIRGQRSGSARWQLTMPPGTTELTFPAALPSNADRDEVLGSTLLEAFVGLCEPTLSPEAYRGLCRRFSQSEPVNIHLPAAWGSPEERAEAP